MTYYYVLPVLLIGVMLAYTMLYRRAQSAHVAAVGAPEAFHQHYAAYFSSLGPQEKLLGVWQGLDYTGATSTAGRVAGAALNEAAGALLGVKTYVPTLFVALTTAGRVVVAREHSEMLQRGNFAEVASLGPGVRAVPPASAGVPIGSAPVNPFDPRTPLELVHVVSADGRSYTAWLAPGTEVSGARRPLAQALPAT